VLFVFSVQPDLPGIHTFRCSPGSSFPLQLRALMLARAAP
jgi:hypothetical protein